MDRGYIAAGVFIALQKAFDTVNHQIICAKLAYYGFRGKSLNLIKSFLNNRKQFVSINGFESSKLNITCGVPQGSTLGPLLFLIYSNDLRFCLNKSSSNHFTDDTCLIYASKKVKTLEIDLNADLKATSEWLKANRLSLSIKKSQLIIFHSKSKKVDFTSFLIKLEGSKLKPSKYVKNLGIYIDENLSWSTHINELSKKINRANGILAKLRYFATKKILILVYYAIFYSQLLYGCSVWSLTTVNNIDTIRILQKKCIRIINHAPYNSHTNNLFEENKFLKLDDIIKFEQLKFVFLFKNGDLPKELNTLFKLNINTYNTRNASKGGLSIPKINTTSFGIKSLGYSASVTWNECIKSINDFKDIKSINQLKNCILKKLYINS